MVKQIVFHNLELWNCNIVGTEAVFIFHIYMRDHMSVFFLSNRAKGQKALSISKI